MSSHHKKRKRQSSKHDGDSDADQPGAKRQVLDIPASEKAHLWRYLEDVECHKYNPLISISIPLRSLMDPYFRTPNTPPEDRKRYRAKLSNDPLFRAFVGCAQAGAFANYDLQGSHDPCIPDDDECVQDKHRLKDAEDTRRRKNWNTSCQTSSNLLRILPEFIATDKVNHAHALPNEIVVHIFAMLENPVDVVACLRVCKQWSSLREDVIVKMTAVRFGWLVYPESPIGTSVPEQLIGGLIRTNLQFDSYVVSLAWVVWKVFVDEHRIAAMMEVAEEALSFPKGYFHTGNSKIKELIRSVGRWMAVYARSRGKLPVKPTHYLYGGKRILPYYMHDNDAEDVEAFNRCIGKTRTEQMFRRRSSDCSYSNSTSDSEDE